MRISALAAAMLAILAACSSGTSEGAQSAARAQGGAAVHPESGLSVIGLTISHEASDHAFRVEVARTEREQAKGLMFRTAMGADEGMIFPMDPPRDAAFWMKNTVIPLDIIFIGPDKRILNIAANAEPYSETPLPSAGPVSAVLELNGGRAEQLGIGRGDLVRW